MNYKELIEKYIEREISDICVGPLTEASRYHFQKCADLLTPMLVEALDALKELINTVPYNYVEPDYLKRHRETLLKIEKQLGVERGSE